jgi:uncharacterized protein (TIGR03083 family)
MVDDRDLEGMDPYDLMEQESGRIDEFYAGLDAAAFKRPTRCEGWDTRDVLAHLAASEEYNTACLEGTVAAFMAALAAKGATDLSTANDIGIHELDDRSTDELLALWRARITENRERLRKRDGDDIDSSVGAYSARWQAFHLAFELATHADDVGVPVRANEEPARTAWQARFARFALKEGKPDLQVEASAHGTHVRGNNVDVDLPDAVFVQAAAARLPDGSGVDEAAVELLSVTP